MSNPFPRSVGASGRGLSVPSRALIAALTAKLSSTINLWSARSRQRKALAELAGANGHLLKDIGIKPDQALREAARWFWEGDHPHENFSGRPQK
jgi:uncharacterized protein YjiS (DUF1127 family)